MTNAPQHYSTVTTSGDCTYTYPGTPDEFDVDIGGRHDAGEFKLQLSTKVLATYQLTFSSCANPAYNRTGAFPGRAPFGGFMTPAFFRPHVRAQDGATNSLHDDIASIDVTAQIEIHEAAHDAR